MAFPVEPAENIHVKKHKSFIRKVEQDNLQYSTQKTAYLLRKGLSIQEISKKRGIKESTAWNHIAECIEYNQLSLWKILSKEKISSILFEVHSEHDKLKEIRERLSDSTITYDQIQCVLAYVKSKNRAKNICHHIDWYKRTHCHRKCYFNPAQRMVCANKFDTLISRNPMLEMKQKEFIQTFNNYMTICVLPDKEKWQYITWKEFNSKREQMR